MVMLESIREGVRKPWMKFLIFFIIVSFVFAGYFTSALFLGDPNAVVTINDESITNNEFQQAYSRVKANQADYYKANVKTEEDEKVFQENVLQQLITAKVTEQSMTNLGLRLSKGALKKAIQNDPNYQIDGKYSSARVNQTIVRLGMSRADFKQAHETQATTRQLNSGLFETGFSLDAETQNAYELMAQKRSGRALSIKIAPFKASVKLNDEEINQYYNENKESFRIPESVSVEYLELSVDKLKAEQKPTAEKIELYYQENEARFKADDQRQYSHILILSKDNDDLASKKAKAISERLAQGEDFAEIAKQESDDIPTKILGGDLGILLPGSLEEASEEAVKLLTQVGDVTPAIKLEDGYQILKLTNLTEGEMQPLDQVRAELVSELSQQLAEEVFYAKSELLKEKSFEFSDSLAEAATAINLKVQTSPMFGRNSGSGIFANTELKDAAFSADVLEDLLNSQPIEITPQHIVVVRLKKHQASAISELASVREKVTNSLQQSKSKIAAQTLADTLLEKLKAREKIQDILQANQLKWIELDKVESNNAVIPYLANVQFFKMILPSNDTRAFELVEDFQGYTILVLNQVEKGNWADADDATKKQRELYISSYFVNAEYESYKQSLRNNADVKRNLNSATLN